MMMMTLASGAPDYTIPTSIASPGPKDVMLDLETWGVTPGCAIRSIGACLFDPGGKGVAAAFYRNIRRDTCEEWGFRVEPKTEAWWSEQSDEAKEALAGQQIGIVQAVRQFQAWWSKHKAERVWCHGANFDAPIWQAVCEGIGCTAPWHYRDVRDTRTLYHIANVDLDSFAHVGVIHNAIDDSERQVLAAQEAVNKLW